jgi:ABC-2 type transport system ATP-binding protein
MISTTPSAHMRQVHNAAMCTTPAKGVRHLQALLAAGMLLLMAACGSDGSGPQPASLATLTTNAAQAEPADFPGSSNSVPVQPASGSRPGQVYRVYITGGLGERVAFSVFEPDTLTAGQTYPLVLHGHGFSSSRTTSKGQSNPVAPGDIDSLTAAGYGVISIDQRGHGESTGTIRVMDPDFEGTNLIRILNWAERHLPWLRYGTGPDGEPNNLVLGSIGGSYGGMYQFVIRNIDPKKRLDAMSAQISPNDLTFALFPNGVVKTEWDITLFGLGNTAGLPGGTFANFDPFVTQFFQRALTTNRVDQAGRDFFYYHSNAYFCNGRTVATNGGPGTVPAYAPRPAHAVNMLLYQGMRDTLFNYTDAIRNYRCFAQAGGDVRLFSYQSGHNTIYAATIDDPGLATQPGGPNTALDSNCGPHNVNEATLKFFNKHLKGIANADAGLPAKVCVSLATGDAIELDDVPDATRTAFPSQLFTTRTVPVVPNTTPLSGGPFVIEYGAPIGAGGGVLAGIGSLQVTVSNPQGGPGEPIIFFGVGHQKPSNPLYWDLLDNQILPVRGTGTFNLELVGVAERLAPGDKLALLVYGGNRQYAANGSLSVPAPFVGTVSIAGRFSLPVMGNLPNLVTP